MTWLCIAILGSHPIQAHSRTLFIRLTLIKIFGPHFISFWTQSNRVGGSVNSLTVFMAIYTRKKQQHNFICKSPTYSYRHFVEGNDMA